MPDLDVATGSLHALLRNAYRVHADRTAIIDDFRSLTFADTEAEVRAVIAGLADAGLEAGDCVAVISAGRSECAVLDQACFLGGFVRLAINKRLHPREAAEILRLANARAVVVDDEWASGLAPELAGIPSLGPMIRLQDRGPDTPAEQWTYAELVERGRAHRGATPAAGDDRAPAQLSFTSGTTGTPKAAVHDLRAVAASVRNTIIETGAERSDVVYTAIPLSHVGGIFVLAYFVRGATQIIAGRFEPDDALDALQNRGVTALITVPAMLTTLNEAMPGHRAPHLRRIIYGSSPMQVPDIVRTNEIFGPVLTQLYGQTESGLPITALGVADHIWQGDPPPHLASAGRPTPFVEVLCVDESGGEVPRGDVGEIAVRGDSMMSGYLGNPEATAEVMLEGGWMRTGDLGRFDDDGRLYLVGRSRDVVISGGFNVYPIEVENVIMTLPSVKEVAVVGTPHERWGEAVSAAVVLREGAEFDPDEIERVCRENLAGFKIPRVIVPFDELPRNAVGKVLKKSLGELIASKTAARHD